MFSKNLPATSQTFCLFSGTIPFDQHTHTHKENFWNSLASSRKFEAKHFVPFRGCVSVSPDTDLAMLHFGYYCFSNTCHVPYLLCSAVDPSPLRTFLFLCLHFPQRFLLMVTTILEGATIGPLRHYGTKMPEVKLESIFLCPALTYDSSF